MSSADFDFSDFLNFAQNFHKTLQEEQFVLDVMNRLGNLLIREVKLKTPVGQYDGTVFFATTSGKLAVFEGGAKKQGGALRRNWELVGASKQGNSYIVELANNTEYASYVENGHRTIRGGWVEGQFFLKITMAEIESQLPSIVGPMYRKYLESFGVS